MKLLRDGQDLILRSDDIALIVEVARHKRTQAYVLEQRDANTLVIDAARRGHVKQALVAIGYPAEDLAGYADGPRRCRSTCANTRCKVKAFELRQYQRDAVHAFYANGTTQRRQRRGGAALRGGQDRGGHWRGGR